MRFSSSTIASIFPVEPGSAFFFFNCYYLPVPFDLKHELSFRYLFKYYALIYQLSRSTPTLMFLSISGFRKTMLTYFRRIYSNLRLQLCFHIRFLEDSAYLLQTDCGYVHIYCQMTNSGMGTCDGGGWTLVMKIDG